MKQTLSLCLILLVSVGVSFSQGQRVSFYFAAHPDDWQLFMGVNAFKDIADASTTGNRVVFIYATAGEANCNGMGINKAYFLARQDGANRSIQFCADIYSPHSQWSSSKVTIQGTTNHTILQLQYKNVVCYFLRLPDGCFEQTKHTLTKFAHEHARSLTAVDSSTTYHGYDDLVETVKNIVAHESNILQQPEVWLNASDWDAQINPNDHPDHVQTGRLATEVASKIDYANVRLFEGYNSCHEAPNLSPEEIAMEASLHSQVCFGLTHEGWGSEWDPQSGCGHVNWTTKNYFRVYSTASDAKVTSTWLTMNPNPVTGKTMTLTYEVTANGPVNIVLLDMLGNAKGTLVNDNESIGVHTINYDIASLPAGSYIVNAKTQGYIHTLRFTRL